MSLIHTSYKHILSLSLIILAFFASCEPSKTPESKQDDSTVSVTVNDTYANTGGTTTSTAASSKPLPSLPRKDALTSGKSSTPSNTPETLLSPLPRKDVEVSDKGAIPKNTPATLFPALPSDKGVEELPLVLIDRKERTKRGIKTCNAPRLRFSGAGCRR